MGAGQLFLKLTNKSFQAKVFRPWPASIVFEDEWKHLTKKITAQANKIAIGLHSTQEERMAMKKLDNNYQSLKDLCIWLMILAHHSPQRHSPFQGIALRQQLWEHYEDTVLLYLDECTLSKEIVTPE